MHRVSLASRLLPLCGIAIHVLRADPAAPGVPFEIIASDVAELAAIRRQVAEAVDKLGDAAGIPEEPDTYEPIPKDGSWLTAAEAKAAFAKAIPKLEQMRWWKTGIDPRTLTHPLREPAAVISGCLAAHRAGLEGADRGLDMAREAADFLVWAQTEGGTGVYPFPFARSVNMRDKAFAAAGRYVEKAEREGKLDQVIRNGWLIEDSGDGGLQFDNGEAGISMLELYECTHDEKYLRSAIKAADWAMSRPLVKNWNYNSFSVGLLAKAYEVTRERKYLDSAKHKALIGVIPGQLTSGPRAGRWFDAHNARPAYHYIMLRALARLAAAMPNDDTARPEVMRALQLGLLARNRDFSGPGAPNRNKAVEALVFVNRRFAGQVDFLRDSQSAEALDALGRLVSEQYRQGKAPLGPGEWGSFLEFAVWQAERRAAP
jgi:hypothetical protein